ncbi:MAG TPA: TolC family protein [Paludibacter sp.]|nr:TolC family protein [Paludibacter sp.]
MKIKKYVLVISLVSTGLASAQVSGDSLALSDVLGQVMKNYPLLKKSEKELDAADAKIGLTKTAYLPDVAFSASYTRIGPTTAISMPIGGALHTLELFPPNVYSAAFSVNQSIYDFGKTDKNLAVDQRNKEMLELNASQTKQRLSMAVMGSFYTISMLQEAIRIKDEQLKALNEHLQFIEKRAATGSATKYDVLSTNVRVSATENQRIDLAGALQVQASVLNSYLGRPANSPLKVRKELNSTMLVSSTDSLCNEAFANRSELKITRQKEEISKSKIDVVAAQNRPSLNAFASGGFKNGYFNSRFEDTGRLNYAVGVGLKMPVFDASRSKQAKIMAKADLEANQQDTELAKRNITNEVIENRENALSALKKVKQSELQLQQASQAYELAKISFEAGSITNLDLLNANTQLSESEFALFKAKIDYTVSLLKLKLATGGQIY